MAADPYGEAEAVAEVNVVAVELPDLSTRVQWYEDWEEQTAEPQKLSRRDRRYVDHDQWEDWERKKLRDRKQPILTKNRIHPKLQHLLGEVIARRTDPSGLPRTPAHEDDAIIATDALRYVADEQNTDQVELGVAENMLVEGYGGSIKEIEETIGPDGQDAKHMLRHVEWDRLFYDPKSRAKDFSDAKYLGIVLWMDLDDALVEYPHAAEELQQAVAQAQETDTTTSTTLDAPRGWIDTKRKRVKISEMYFRVGENYYRADFTKAADLREPALTGYLDEDGKKHLCPLQMRSLYVDSNGYRYGVVRGWISPQDEINKRSSKALNLLNTKNVIAEENAIPDPEAFRQELMTAGGIAFVGDGRLTDGTVQIQDNNIELSGHIALLQEAKQEIDEVGPSAAQIATGPGTSGREVIARRQAANMGLGTFFDGLDEWKQRVTELDWACIRNKWTGQKWLRVRDDQEIKGHRFVGINQRIPRAKRFAELLQKEPPVPVDEALSIAAGVDAQAIMAAVQYQLQQLQGPALEQHMAQMLMQHPAMQEVITTNQVAKMGIDIVLDAAPDTAVVEQEEFENISNVAGTILQTKPEMAPKVGKMLLKASQLRNKRELLEEWDKGPTPEEQQQAAQAQQMQMAQMQLQVKLAETQLQLTQAQTQLTLAKAQAEQSRMAKEMADAEHTQAETAAIPSEIELNQARAAEAEAKAGETEPLPGVFA